MIDHFTAKASSRGTSIGNQLVTPFSLTCFCVSLFQYPYRTSWRWSEIPRTFHATYQPPTKATRCTLCCGTARTSVHRSTGKKRINRYGSLCGYANQLRSFLCLRSRYTEEPLSERFHRSISSDRVCALAIARDLFVMKWSIRRYAGSRVGFCRFHRSIGYVNYAIFFGRAELRR